MYVPAHNRTLSASASVSIVGVGLAALFASLSWETPSNDRPELLRAILPMRNDPDPQPRPKPQPTASKGAPHDPAPSGHAQEATQIVLPAPPYPIIASSPVPIAPVAGTGSATSQGAATDGNGQGAGGSGTGYGGGEGNGKGPAGDESSRAPTYPRQIGGKLHYWEIPKELRQDHGGVVRLRYVIGVDGRASDCTVLQSSGISDFDQETCAHIVERFRFKPALDVQGHPVPFVMTETHGWNYSP